MRCVNRLTLVLCCSAAVLATTSSPARGQSAPAVRDSVPADLRPLLAPHHSELRLVIQRYQLDRNLLANNYAGAPTGGRGGRGGRGNARPDTTLGPPVVLSPDRIARLQHFDRSWQAALAALDASHLTPEAQRDLDSLRHAVVTNIARADSEATDLARLLPAFPFAGKLVGLIEARMRLEDVDAEPAAGILAAVTAQIDSTRAGMRSGLAAGATGTLQASRIDALRSAVAVETLRSNLAAWFTFYDAYDPAFTWWVDLPYQHVDTALANYATFLRDSVAVADRPSILPRTWSMHVTDTPPPPTYRYYGEFFGGYDPAFRLVQAVPYKPVDPVTGAPALHAADFRGPALSEVPDLASIISLPQDEMTDIVNRFFGRSANGGRGGSGRGGRGGTGGANAAPAPLRDSTFYEQWLNALKTLDFDKLTRNAQVDYLYVRKMAELQLARQGHPLLRQPAAQGRTTPAFAGEARGRQGLIRDLQDELIPYTPEELIVARREGVRLVRRGDERRRRARWASATTGRPRSRR